MVSTLCGSQSSRNDFTPFRRTGLLILIWATLQMVAFTKDLYVSPSGSDTNSGSIEFPLAKIQAGVNRLQPGDTLYVRGGTYREKVVFSRSGTIRQRITVEAFPGEQPIISGCEPVTGWTLWDSTNNIWKAPMRWTLGIGRNQIFSHGQVMLEARYPNRASPGLEIPIEGLSPLWPTFGPFSVPKGSSTNRPGLVVSELLRNQAPDFWKGAIYIGVHWDGYVIQSGIVESSRDGELIVGKRSGQWWHTGDKYYDKEFGRGMMVGHLHALDQPGEWHWQNDTLYFIPPNGKPLADVEAKARQLALDLSHRSYITVKGLNIFAASARLEDCVDCLIDDCKFEYLSHFTRMWALDTPEQGRNTIQDGEAGIYVSGHDNGIVGCRIHVSAGAGINIRGYHQIIHNNLVDEVNYVGHYLNAVSEGIGDQLENEHQRVGGHVISFNTFRNAGRHFYNIHSGYALISQDRAPMDYVASLFVHNHLYNGMLTTRDAGFVTSFFSSGGTLNGLSTQIAYNVMQDDFDFEGLRIALPGLVYLDNGTRNVDVHHNLFTARRGTVQNPIFLNSGRINIHVTNNAFLGRFEGTAEDIKTNQFPGGKSFEFGHDFSKKRSIPRWPPIQSQVLPVTEYWRNNVLLTASPLTIGTGDVLNLGEVNFSDGWNSLIASFSSESPTLPKKSVGPTGPRHKKTSDPLVLDSSESDERHLASTGSDGSGLEPDGWLRFNQVNLGDGYKRFRLVFANTNTRPRHIEIRLDAPDGPLVGALTLPLSDVYRRDRTWGFAEITGELAPMATNQHTVFVIGRADDKQVVGLVGYLRFEQYKGEIRYSSTESRIEVHIDRPTGERIGDIFPRFTSSSRNFVELVASLDSPAGTHPVYLVAKAGQSGVLGTLTNLRMERAYQTNLWSLPEEGSSTLPTKPQQQNKSSAPATQKRATLEGPGLLNPSVRPLAVASSPAPGLAIDGLLAEWNSPSVILRQRMDGVAVQDRPAKIWMASDSNSLYFAAEAPLAATNPGGGDASQTWNNWEWMEIALSAESKDNAPVIHGFRGRIDGIIRAMDSENPGAEFSGRDVPGVEFKTSKSALSWTCEWRIPFSALGVHGTPPQKWLCNVSLVSPKSEDSRTWAYGLGSSYDLDFNGGELSVGPVDSILPEALKRKFLAWFDSSELSTVEHGSNGKVTAWHDRLRPSLVASQTKTANQPVFDPKGLNGKPTISFNGADSMFLTAPSLNDSTNNSTMGFVVFCNPTPAAHPSEYERLFATSDGDNYDYRSGLTVAIDKLETGGPRIAEARSMSAAFKQPRIGAMSPKPATFLTGSISEILVCQGILSQDEERLIDVYLRSKWGLEPK